MRLFGGRDLRFKLVAGLSFALALPGLGKAAETPRGVTATTLSAETQDLDGHTQATVSVNVTGEDGQPAQGAVILADRGRELAGILLDPAGHATALLNLSPGDHLLTATYEGDSSHFNSVSETRPIRAVTGSAPDFSIAVAPASISLKQGQSGAVTASITPVNSASLSAPMFVTLSCSGLPDQSRCSFTPENIEIPPGASAAVNSTLNLATSAQGQLRVAAKDKPLGVGTAWAILLPGTLGLAGFAFRRRRWISRLSLFALLGLVGVLGTSGCNPLYNYHNHGPSANLPTPAGSYKLLITAQSSNGITAITHSTTMVLTVQ